MFKTAFVAEELSITSVRVMGFKLLYYSHFHLKNVDVL